MKDFRNSFATIVVEDEFRTRNEGKAGLFA